MKKKIQEEKKKPCILTNIKEEITKDIEKNRKIEPRPTNIRKTNVKKTNLKEGAFKNKLHFNEENGHHGVKIVLIKDSENQNVFTSKDSDKSMKTRMTKTRITKFIQKRVNLHKEESEESNEESDDFLVLKNPLKRSNLKI